MNFIWSADKNQTNKWSSWADCNLSNFSKKKVKSQRNDPQSWHFEKVVLLIDILQNLRGWKKYFVSSKFDLLATLAAKDREGAEEMMEGSNEILENHKEKNVIRWKDEIFWNDHADNVGDQENHRQ